MRITSLLLAGFVIPCTFACTLASDLFPDKGLEAAVRQQVFEKRNNDDPLTKDDVKDIAVLRGGSLEIKDLTGLEHCLAVQQIDLSDNALVDISPLAGLTKLMSLDLSNNKITDISPLKKLTKLQYLNIEDNQVRKLAPLVDLKAMRSLYMTNNKIERLGQLKNMSQLWTLYVGGNPIKAAAVVRRLEKVDRINMSDCGLENVDFLKPMKRLRSVYLANNKLNDLQTFVDMARADKEKRFAPFLQVHVEGNPLAGEKVDSQLAELKELRVRVHTQSKKEKADTPQESK
ncbi:MAG TPA: hypothetical protein DDW52_14720 [Planctomycetaceae bacterium]|nr:hypothetical protein [Planctomycetaceae bacterium]